MRWLLLVGLNAFVAAGAAAQDIGVAEWVHPPAWGTPPGVAQRDAIVQFRAMTPDELVQTNPKGASNFQFDLGSGKCLTNSNLSTPCFAVKQEGQDILVQI